MCACMRLSCFFSQYVVDINPGEVRWFADTFPFCREDFFPIVPFHLVDYLFYCAEAFSLRYFQFLLLLFALLVLVIFKWFPADWIFQAQPKLISFSLDYVPCFLVSVYI